MKTMMFFPPASREPSLNHSKGFSLIEVLVTLLLVTIGILGVVAMQSRGIQMTQDSVQRNSAIELTNQIVDVMRANPTALYTGAQPLMSKGPTFNGASIFLKSTGSNFSPAPAAVTAADCLVPGNVQNQRDCWLEDVKARLPNSTELITSRFYICRSSEPGNCNNLGSTLEIQLAWGVKKGTCPHNDLSLDDSTCIYRSRIEL